MKIGERILLTKISDDVFEGKHPNYINTGYQMLGAFPGNPIISERYTIPGRHMHEYLRTSIVTEILEDTDDILIFKTENSTYKIEKFVENTNVGIADL